MSLKNLSKCIVIACTILILLVKFYIRPYVHIAANMQLFIDVAPNLGGTFLLPFAACWLLKKYFPMKNNFDVKVICFIGLALVIIDEYLQLIPFFGRTFDYFDIIASFIGTFIGYKVFTHLLSKSFVRKPL